MLTPPRTVHHQDFCKRRPRHSSSGHAVWIDPGLRSRFPENGNISTLRRRLSAILFRKWPNSESGDRSPIRKSQPLAAISGITDVEISRRRTGWLGREDSNLRTVESKSTAYLRPDEQLSCSELTGFRA